MPVIKAKPWVSVMLDYEKPQLSWDTVTDNIGIVSTLLVMFSILLTVV